MLRLRGGMMYIFFCTAATALVACAPSLAERKTAADHSRNMGEGYLGENNVSAALASLLEAERLYDKDPHTQYALGLAYFAKEEYESAILHFKKAVALKPDYSEAFNALGTVYLKQEKWDDAASYFETAASNLLYATPYVAFNNLGDAYRGKKNFEQAVRFYRKALADNPSYPNAYRGIALVSMERGDYREAVDYLLKAGRHAPNSTIIYMDLGASYAALYEYQKAIDAYNRVIAIQPNAPISDRALEEIEKIKSLK